MKKTITALLLLPSLASAAPFLVSDVTSQGVTICVVDGVDYPVERVGEGVRCHVDLSGSPLGVNNLQVSFANVDPVWGRNESTKVNFSFTRPGLGLSAPAGLVLSPQ